MVFGICVFILVCFFVKVDNIRQSEYYFFLFFKILVFLFNIFKNYYLVVINEKFDFFFQFVCFKIIIDGCKNVMFLIKVVLGFKVDVCGVSCCYIDKCNIKDFVVFLKFIVKFVVLFFEVFLIINFVFFLLVGIVVIVIQCKEVS